MSEKCPDCDRELTKHIQGDGRCASQWHKAGPFPPMKYERENMTRKAQFWIHGVPASRWEQVAQYLTGDAHDRSKVQIVADGKFYDVDISSLSRALERNPHLDGDQS